MVEAVAVTSFTEFVRETEPRLKLALSAAFGRELGVEAPAHALAYGWEHWDRVKDLQNRQPPGRRFVEDDRLLPAPRIRRPPIPSNGRRAQAPMMHILI